MKEQPKKGRRKVAATTVKPIGPIIVNIEDPAEYQRILNYASKKQKTKSEGLERARALLKKRQDRRK